MRSQILHLLSRRERIYILPTSMGVYFNGLIFLMFLLSIGYSNNLLLIFTLLLFGLNLLWLVQTHFYLHQFRLGRLNLEDHHAGSLSSYQVQWLKSPKGPLELKLELLTDNGNVTLADGGFIWPARGVWSWQRLKMSTDRPYGLYRAFRFVSVQGTAHAYPALMHGSSLGILDGLGQDGQLASGQKGPHDFLGLGAYKGHEMRKISWKHYARLGELLIKEGESLQVPMARLKWDPRMERKEEALSELATQMVLCFRASLPFTFEIDGRLKGPAVTARQLADCLKDLSIC
jgi:uncharacterized protein (DUF58 family)